MTTFLIDRLKSDKNLRRICGWGNRKHLPSESTFSRAFAEFANLYDLMDSAYDVPAIYNERSTAERVNSCIKDEFWAYNVRVRGHLKVACHLMFGLIALATDQLMKLVT